MSGDVNVVYCLVILSPLIRYQLMEDQGDKSETIALTVVAFYTIGSTKTREDP